MADDQLELARAGDADAFRDLVREFEREIHVHCYRILGSVADADDALQETLLRAWRGLGGFEGRSSLRTWLYRIATNLCLNMRRSAARRPASTLPAHVEPPTPTRLGEVPWLEPYPDVLLDELADSSLNPAARYETNETISLAFTTALQLLPARQRAVLILRDVLDYPARDVAAMLEVSEQSVHSLLKRARTTVSHQLPSEGAAKGQPLDAAEQELVEQLTRTFTRGDVDGLVALLTDDVWVRMPPLPLEYQGKALALAFFTKVAFREDRRYRVVPTRANRQPALGMYVVDQVTGTAHGIGLLVVEISGTKISAITRFDPALMKNFGLPRTL